jgi:hypothetical protein
MDGNEGMEMRDGAMRIPAVVVGGGEAR